MLSIKLLVQYKLLVSLLDNYANCIDCSSIYTELFRKSDLCICRYVYKNMYFGSSRWKGKSSLSKRNFFIGLKNIFEREFAWLGAPGRCITDKYLTYHEVIIPLLMFIGWWWSIWLVVVVVVIILLHVSHFDGGFFIYCSPSSSQNNYLVF